MKRRAAVKTDGQVKVDVLFWRRLKLRWTGQYNCRNMGCLDCWLGAFTFSRCCWRPLFFERSLMVLTEGETV